MDELLWRLLGYGVLPLWLIAGLLDYALHQRTAIALTAGPRESRLHLVQMLQVGVPVLVVLFLELNLLALAILVAAAVAHTVTAYWDVHYASERRVILPLEQVVHAFLFTLPLFATAMIVIMHWPVVSSPTGLLAPASGHWGLRLRNPPWDAGVITGVLLASLLFAVLPALAEYWQVRKASRSAARATPVQGVDTAVPPDAGAVRQGN